MNTHSIKFQDKIRNLPKLIFLTISYFEQCEQFGAQEQVRKSHGKRAIGVRVIKSHCNWTPFGVDFHNRAILYKRKKFLKVVVHVIIIYQ